MISDDDSPEKKSATDLAVKENGDETKESHFQINDFLQKRDDKSGLEKKKENICEPMKASTSKDTYEKKDSNESINSYAAENGVSEDDEDDRCSPVISSCLVSYLQ